MTNTQIKAISKHWEGLTKEIPLRTIKNESDYQKATNSLHNLLDIVGNDESHELSNLLHILGQFIHEYETSKNNFPKASAVEVIRFLMKRDGLKQSDLSPDMGGQSVVSAILKGQRELNIRQIRSLSHRFNVPASMFI